MFNSSDLFLRDLFLDLLFHSFGSTPGVAFKVDAADTFGGDVKPSGLDGGG